MASFRLAGNVREDKDGCNEASMRPCMLLSGVVRSQNRKSFASPQRKHVPSDERTRSFMYYSYDSHKCGVSICREEVRNHKCSRGKANNYSGNPFSGLFYCRRLMNLILEKERLVPTAPAWLTAVSFAFSSRVSPTACPVLACTARAVPYLDATQCPCSAARLSPSLTACISRVA